MKIVSNETPKAAMAVNPAPLSSGEEQALLGFAAHCEESALELAARLRVLARSMVQGQGRLLGRAARFSVSYADLRNQFHSYLAFLATEQATPHFAVIRNYLDTLLPANLDQRAQPQGCLTIIARLERVMALLCEPTGAACMAMPPRWEQLAAGESGH